MNIEPSPLHAQETLANMSNEFSNTSTGGKAADQYTRANLDTETPLKEKVEGLSKFISSTKFGMMTTRDSKTGNLVSRCMAVAAQETGGIDLLFMTNTESNKTTELANDPHINIAFLDTSGDWASISGTSSIETDRELVKKHYNPALKAWYGDLGDGVHDGSENDPRIGVIRVKAVSATYAADSKGLVRGTVEIATAAVKGRPAEVNKLREITEEDVKKWRAVHH